MRRKRRESAPPVRLSDEVAAIVQGLVASTGWSEGATFTFLLTAGWNAVGGKGDQLGKYRDLVKAAVEHHEAEATAKRKLSATASKLREARRALPPSTLRR